MELIDEKALLGVNIHIFAIGFMEKQVFCFTEVTEVNEKTNEDNKKVEPVFNS